MDNKAINCNDIYDKVFLDELKAIKTFVERKSKSQIKEADFKYVDYAEPEFYFYDFAIHQIEDNTKRLLRDILTNVSKRYGKTIVELDKNAEESEFSFIIIENNKTIGYRFDDFCIKQDPNAILDKCGIDEACIIRLYKAAPYTKNSVDRDCNFFTEKKQKAKVILFEDLFIELFGYGEYEAFEQKLEKFKSDVKTVLGIATIEIPSYTSFYKQKNLETSVLETWDYDGYVYSINGNKGKNRKRNIELSDSLISQIKNDYFNSGIYKSLIGTSSYAKSFMTSEWLYRSLKNRTNYDYTSVISGYLKSIEQLALKIVEINIDKGCKILLRSNMREDAIINHIPLYKWSENDKKWEIINTVDSASKIPLYVDYKKELSKYSIDVGDNSSESSMGKIGYFFKFNKHIFINDFIAKQIIRMFDDFREVFRNDYFHIHNLYDWNIVKKVRSDAIFLYFLLLGGCNIDETQKEKLQIKKDDYFDELCKKIREYRHFGLRFIFEYANAKTLYLFYDYHENTMEFDGDGVEHYYELVFYNVGSFDSDIYEKLSRGLLDNNRFHLTRNNIPDKVYCIKRNGEKVEL